MLYLIGLGLNFDGISEYGLDVANRCKRVYLESYTVEFPYTEGELRDKLGLKKLISLDRAFVESEKIVDEAQKQDVALLIYGSPLTATTHISLINEAKRLGVRYKIIYAGSIFDAVAETGLQLYKFGKIASMPTWKKSFEPDSFIEIVKENKSINAHSLILVDIGLDFQAALGQLKIAAKNHDFKLNRFVVCSRLGTKNSKIHYKFIEEYQEFSGIKAPFCFIIPEKLHFLEKEFLEEFM